MMLLWYLMCFLIIPKGYFSEDPTTFVFPKDRSYTSPKRIVGGEVAPAHAYPFQVALYIFMTSGTFFCGGSLLSPMWVLTAAHCLADDNPVSVRVILGSHDLNAPEDSRVTLDSTTYIIHEGWNETTRQNDVALIQLPRNVTLDDYIDTISYTRSSSSFLGQIGTILGWGLTETTTSISGTLRRVNASIISNADCAATDSAYQAAIVDSHLCTSGTGVVGSCNGDSGGPLVIDGVQVGIVSFGSSNCTASKPSVFARLTHYSDWIGQYVSNGNSLKVSAIVAVVLCLSHLIFSS